jgi:hypothetical protein
MIGTIFGTMAGEYNRQMKFKANFVKLLKNDLKREYFNPTIIKTVWKCNACGEIHSCAVDAAMCCASISPIREKISGT